MTPIEVDTDGRFVDNDDGVERILIEEPIYDPFSDNRKVVSTTDIIRHWRDL